MKIKSNITQTSWRAAKWRRMLAFTLIEIMVVMVLLSVIILGLMAMFDQTQKAFRAGMTQTDQLEAGRMFTDLLGRELEEVTPCYQTNGMNFYAQIPLYAPLIQNLPASQRPRTEILQDLYFISRDNQTWNCIGYYVRTNPDLGFFGGVGLVGSLYRFETNVPVGQMNGLGALLPYNTYLNATNRFNVSKVLDGVVDFQVHCYDTNGFLLTNGVPINNSFYRITNSLTIAPGEVEFYGFSNNIVPAYVEVELGILEPAILRQYNSIPDPLARSNYLANHAGNVQLFRQRIAVRNVNPCAYTTNNCFSN
ncbi:MAG TPA: prepilin-type N-terminal cleavage/methylation domain-containing protein [Candidatus Polarisedimenticolia bacterium]|nr:prepilin-type N-terminal cleavage/methylation domain-containing protein [Candidatus Polarisedimenticolia bacterium]